MGWAHSADVQCSPSVLCWPCSLSDRPARPPHRHQVKGGRRVDKEQRDQTVMVDEKGKRGRVREIVSSEGAGGGPFD